MALIVIASLIFEFYPLGFFHVVRTDKGDCVRLRAPSTSEAIGYAEANWGMGMIDDR